MKQWTYKLTVMDYRFDIPCKRELIRTVQGEFESDAYNDMAFSLKSHNIDIEDCELFEEKVLSGTEQ